MTTERDPERVCGARNRQGKPCQRWTMRGQFRCEMHGGRSPRGLAAGRRRLAEADARETLARLGEASTVVTDPVRVLQEIAGEALELKDLLRERVARLTALRYETGAGEQTRGELAAYERALDRTAKICESLAKLGLDERAQRLSEETGAILLGLTLAAFNDPRLGMTEDQVSTGRQVMAELIGSGDQVALAVRYVTVNGHAKP